MNVELSLKTFGQNEPTNFGAELIKLGICREAQENQISKFYNEHKAARNLTIDPQNDTDETDIKKKVIL